MVPRGRIRGHTMDNQSNKYILKALEIANSLLDLANNEDALGDDAGCSILFGVMRDCAYKIWRQAEREARKAMGK
jgi:hypothetical protein